MKLPMKIEVKQGNQKEKQTFAPFTGVGNLFMEGTKLVEIRYD